jgi:hypothetical protein
LELAAEALVLPVLCLNSDGLEQRRPLYNLYQVQPYVHVSAVLVNALMQ